MKIENIILNGCSFVHGDDLCFQRYNIPVFSPIRDTLASWNKEQLEHFENVRLSGQLKRYLNCNVINLANSGSSNSQIANCTFTYLEEHKKELNPDTTLVIIGWTENHRYDYFFDDCGKLTISIPKSEVYKRVFKRRLKHVNDSDIKKYEAYIKHLDNLKSYSDLFNDHVSMSYVNYIYHIQLINMMQLQLEKFNFKYMFFNSLSHYPLNSQPRKECVILDNLINWENWFPYFNKDSYWYSWDESIRDRSELNTESYHPSELAVEKFAKELSMTIKTRY